MVGWPAAGARVVILRAVADPAGLRRRRLALLRRSHRFDADAFAVTLTRADGGWAGVPAQGFAGRSGGWVGRRGVRMRHAGRVTGDGGGSVSSQVTLDSVRGYLRSQFNAAVRRPGTYGGAVALHVYLEILGACTDGRDHVLADLRALTTSPDTFSRGVPAAFAAIWPGLRGHWPLSRTDSDMAASVFAGIARQRGWLDLDRALTAAEYGMLRHALAGWRDTDSTAAGVLAEYGTPSVLIGGSGRPWPKTFMYATARPADPAVYFHLWNSPGHAGAAPVFAEPALLAARTDDGPFEESFILTPAGRRLAGDPGSCEAAPGDETT